MTDPAAGPTRTAIAEAARRLGKLGGRPRKSALAGKLFYDHELVEMERAERLSSQWGAGSKNGHPLPSAHLNNYTIKFLGKDILWDGSEPASAVAGEQPAFAGQPERSSGQATPNARGQRSSSVADQPDDGKITTHDKLMERLQGTLRALDRMGRPEVADQKELSPLAGEAKPLGRAAKSLQGINGDMLATRRNQLLKDAVLAAKAAQHDR